jgi:rhamnopyranosyl-N-acetylglucosaminyl-diphospho-decaprenol beta-1,3/1,4-galactofuranosyltransferase
VTEGKIAVVVVTYNRLPLLQECIESLRRQTRKPDGIIVVNNSSTDGTSEWLNKQTEIITITQENSGGAGGFYTGIKFSYESGYDWIWCMDDDAEPSNDALEQLVIRIIPVGNIAAISCTVISQNGEICESHRGIFDLNRINKFHLFTPIPYAQYGGSSVLNINYSSFVGIMINKDAVSQIGYPMKEFFVHHDDSEYCLRLLKYGEIILVPSSRIIHKEAFVSKYLVSKRFLWKTSFRPPIAKETFRYYGKRNHVWLLRKYSTNIFYSSASIIKSFIIYLLSILIYDDHKLLRIRLLTNAYCDGINGNFDNKKPKELCN